jgi:hypothetical protein
MNLLFWRKRKKLYTTVHHTSENFDTDLKWNSIEEIDFNEALERVDHCVDDPVLYSNEPIKDIQSWEHIQFLARVGHELVRRKKENTLTEWIEAMQ